MPATPPAYRWIPGQGPDAEALQRLRERAPRPKQPMGEAWFMGGERAMYTGLMLPDPQAWSRRDLDNALDALTSGPRCFDHSDEWSEWFDFLLPRILERADDGGSYDLLVTAVFVHCLDPALPGRAPEFRRDLLDTLGRRLMAPSCWADARDGGRDALLLRPLGRGFHAINPGHAISAACCLVLRYLEAESIDGWIASVLAIDDAAWRCAFVVWLAGAAPLLFDGAQPEHMDNPPHLDIGWNGHWLLDGSVPTRSLDPNARQFAFFGEAQRHALVASLRHRLDLATMLHWGEALADCAISHGTIPECDRATTAWQYDAAVLVVLERYGLN